MNLYSFHFISIALASFKIPENSNRLLFASGKSLVIMVEVSKALKSTVKESVPQEMYTQPTVKANKHLLNVWLYE